MSNFNWFNGLKQIGRNNLAAWMKFVESEIPTLIETALENFKIADYLEEGLPSVVTMQTGGNYDLATDFHFYYIEGGTNGPFAPSTSGYLYVLPQRTSDTHPVADPEVLQVSFTVSPTVSWQFRYGKISEINMGLISWVDSYDFFKGERGYSAYEIWLQEGFTGTKSQFIASLKGEKGDKGDKGDTGATGLKGDAGTNGTDGTNGVDGVDGTDGVDGADGSSAYDIWLSYGNTGTHADFLLSLKGEKGDKGDKGDKGEVGDKGDKGETGAAGASGTVSIWDWNIPSSGDLPPSAGKGDFLVVKSVGTGLEDTYNIGEVYFIVDTLLPTLKILLDEVPPTPALELAELTDVDFGTPTEGQVLTFDEATGMSKFADASGGGEYEILDFPLVFDGVTEPTPTEIQPSLFPDPLKSYKGELGFGMNPLTSGIVTGYLGRGEYFYTVGTSTTIEEDPVTSQISQKEVTFVKIEVNVVYDGTYEDSYLGFATAPLGTVPNYPADFSFFTKGVDTSSFIGKAPTSAGKVYGANGNSWYEIVMPPSEFSLEGLSDTTITSPIAAQVLTFEAGKWKNKALPTPPASVSKLSELTDVDYGTPEEGQVLVYDATSEKVKFTTQESGGGGLPTKFLLRNWIRSPHQAPENCQAIAWSPELGLFASVAGSDFMYSIDGRKWEAATSKPAGSGTFTGMVWAGGSIGLFVAVTQSNNFSGTVITSPDGFNWTVSPYSVHCYGVAYAPELGVLISGQRGSGVSRSTNATSWVASSTSMTDVDWGYAAWSPELGKFCILGNGKVATSSDGSVWTKAIFAECYFDGRVIWATHLGKFVSFLGEDVYTSPDGLTWTLVSAGVMSYPGTILYSPELKCIVAGAGAYATYPLSVSEDAVTWTSVSLAEQTGPMAGAWSPELEQFVLYMMDGTFGNENYIVTTL